MTEDMRKTVESLVLALDGAAADVSCVINNSKVTDHHAILPTMQSVKCSKEKLSETKQKILSLIIWKLVQAVQPPFIYEDVLVTVCCQGRNFTAKYKDVLQPGYTAKPVPFVEPEKDKDVPLPKKLEQGTVLPVVRAEKKQGFNHVVFIIRKDIEKEFKEIIGNRITSICNGLNVTVDYAYQDINDIPVALPEGRTKPWGTGQAVLAAKNILNTPFIVINADDYYGKEGFKAIHEYLVNGGKSCMAGFVLKNTLSDNGGVTRGICKMDNENNLTEVVETKNIVKTTEGAETDGVSIDVNSLVSMNMWGLTPDFLNTLEEGFKEFFDKEVSKDPLKAEYLLPVFIGELMNEGKMSVKVLRSNDTWYGMTYHEDVPSVKDSFKKMLDSGIYKTDLFSDL